MNDWFVYIVRSEKTDQLYTGVTVDLQRRVHEHNHSKRGSKWTRYNRPVKLVWWTGAKSRAEAQRIEYSIRKRTRAEKLLMIEEGQCSTG